MITSNHDEINAYQQRANFYYQRYQKTQDPEDYYNYQEAQNTADNLTHQGLDTDIKIPDVPLDEGGMAGEAINNTLIAVTNSSGTETCVLLSWEARQKSR